MMRLLKATPAAMPGTFHRKRSCSRPRSSPARSGSACPVDAALSHPMLQTTSPSASDGQIASLLVIFHLRPPNFPKLFAAHDRFHCATHTTIVRLELLAHLRQQRPV